MDASRRALLPLLLITLVTACAGTPSAPGKGGPAEAGTPPLAPSEVGLVRSEVVLAALGHLDAPYRYGGFDAAGLDCSALVQRAYLQAGLNHVPRTTAQQARAAHRVPQGRIQPGDVLFFAARGNRIDHVGIFIGDDRFIHAPNASSQVRIEPLTSTYWHPRLRKAGHFFE